MDHNRNDKELYNFEIVAALDKDKAPFDFDPYSLFKCKFILKTWNYFLGMAIGALAQGCTTFPFTHKEDYKFGFGYQPTPEEVIESRRKPRPENWQLGKGS